MISRMLIEYQDMKAAGHSAEQIEQQRLSLVSRLQAEIDRFGNPGRGPIAKLSGERCARPGLLSVVQLSWMALFLTS